MSARVCPICGSRLGSGYQRIGAKEPQFIVFCSRLSQCRSFDSGLQGTGETLDAAVENLHSKVLAPKQTDLIP